MRFIARKPRDGINVSDTHPLAEAGMLIVGLSALFLGLVVAIIFLVELALYFVPAETEARLFRNWLPIDLVTVAPDDERLYQTQALLDRLVAHWPETPYEFTVEIDESDVANAMALPGGLIVVTSGLLDQVESENELAFVLGHELGHFRNRDHLRALGRAGALSIFLVAVAGKDASGLGITLADLTLRGFSRTQEARADEFGLAIVYAEYGHVNAAWRLFERWDEVDRTTLDVAAYFSTHPQAADRIENLGLLADREGGQLDGPVTSLPWPD
jgi:Zn-dependent protease with chaperone function